MYIAMNRFKINRGQEEAFEHVWKTRDTHLDKVPGFSNFHLLKADSNEEYTLYASHSTWNSREDFTNWTKSKAFRQAHKGASQNQYLYIGHPQFEGFEVII